jgi:hypothetical protein
MSDERPDQQSDVDAVLHEIDAVLTEQAREELIAAALREDRESMTRALDNLAAFVPGGERFGVLVAFVRYLLLLAVEQRHVGADETAAARERLASCESEYLEAFAIKLTQLVYGPPDSTAH